MTSRKRRVGGGNRLIAIIATVLVHAIIIGALLFNFTSKPKQTEAAFAEKVDLVKATTVNAADIERQKEKIKKQDLEKQRKEKEEHERLEKLKKQTEQEKQRIQDLKKQQEQEKKKAVELEKKRKQIALKKKQEAEKRKKQKAEAERKRKADQKRQKEKEAAEVKRRLEDSLRAEAAFQAEQKTKQRATTLMGKYSALITQKVSRYWAISTDYVPGLETYVNVKLSSYGDVQSVRILKSSGNPRFDRSVESAILKATPLPIPSVQEDSAVNKEFQDLNITFRPEDLQ